MSDEQHPRFGPDRRQFKDRRAAALAREIDPAVAVQKRDDARDQLLVAMAIGMEILLRHVDKMWPESGSVRGIADTIRDRRIIFDGSLDRS